MSKLLTHYSTSLAFAPPIPKLKNIFGACLSLINLLNGWSELFPFNLAVIDVPKNMPLITVLCCFWKSLWNLSLSISNLSSQLCFILAEFSMNVQGTNGCLLTNIPIHHTKTQENSLRFCMESENKQSSFLKLWIQSQEFRLSVEKYKFQDEKEDGLIVQYYFPSATISICCDRFHFLVRNLFSVFFARLLESSSTET